ncbi:hypothetical protein EcWSU1_01912 [Enterobacter ludwigii]|uniref:Uncharacterized protein n=1 Tax=Enterobacter ludwigii TaxID=299767 RepID=G8LM77_9ENTR|nr:hypothetical protein EcWSU1_01912 [Enterobacter ludwigii]
MESKYFAQEQDIPRLMIHGGNVFCKYIADNYIICK